MSIIISKPNKPFVLLKTLGKLIEKAISVRGLALPRLFSSAFFG